MFDNSRYLTKGVDADIPLMLQVLMWQCIDEMPEPKDYLQVFRLKKLENGNQMIVHSQENPAYKQTYVIFADGFEAVDAKIFVIDDETHSTMLLAEEY